MPTNIRPATQQDARAIWALNTQSLGYSFPEDATTERLDVVLSKPTNTLFVAESDGEVLGYIHIVDYDGCYFGPHKDVIALAVLPTAQGKGIGRALLDAAEARAKADGCNGMRLNSGFGREGAHRFYEACGYHNRKDQKNYVKAF